MHNNDNTEQTIRGHMADLITLVMPDDQDSDQQMYALN